MAQNSEAIVMPPFLKAGDKVAILSPGSTPKDSVVLQAEKVLKGW